MPAIVENVIYQHAENVCTLWLQRHHAVTEPHYTFADLVHLDNRVEANLQGLRVAGEHALPIVDENIAAGEEGSVFTKAVLLLERSVNDMFLDLAEEHCGDREILQELQSALAWVSADCLASTVKALLSSAQTPLVELGLQSCAAHHRPAKNYVMQGLDSDDTHLRATAMQVAADLGLVDIRIRLRSVAEWASDREQFHCGRALAMLGDQRTGSALLHSLAVNDSAFGSEAVKLIAQLNDVSDCKQLLKTLNSDPGRQRDVIKGFGYLGDPAAMDWLISQTAIPDVCRLAGGSISMITGIDLAEHDLETLDAPEGYTDTGPNDNADDERVELDEDEDLPWPEPDRVRAWWQASAGLPTGKYFLNGREKTARELPPVLREGFQRQRNAAADRLALLDPAARFLNTKLPTNKQSIWMQ